MVDSPSTADVDRARRDYQVAAKRARVAGMREDLVREAQRLEQRWADAAARIAD